VLLELAAFLKERGHASQVGVIISRSGGPSSLADEARRQGLEVFFFTSEGRLDARTPARIRAHVRQHGVQVVHAHGYKADILLFLAGLGRSVKVISTCHNWLSNTPKLMAFEFLDKLALHHFDQVVAVSPALDQELAAAGLPVHRRSLIPNGLATEAPPDSQERDEVRAQLGAGEQDLLLITIGRLDPFKAHHVLIDAFSRVRSRAACGVRLAIVGEGERLDALRQQAGELGLDRCVIFTGYRQNIHELLRAGDLFVLSSIKEGLPMVLLEAMGHGLPVVSTAVGAIPALLDHGRCGWLSPAGDAAALAEVIIEALDQPAQQQQKGERARRKFLREHSRQAMGEKYLALYGEILAERR